MNLTEYFETYFINKSYGESYLITQAGYLISVILLMNPIDLSVSGILRKIRECVLGAVFLLLLNSVLYAAFGSTHKDWLPLLIVILAYAGLRSRYRLSTRLVLISIFYSSAFLNMVISEPWGDLFGVLGYDFFGYVGITSLVTVFLFFFLVWYLKRFSTERFVYTPKSGVILMTAICAVAGISQIAFDAMVTDGGDSLRLYDVIVSTCFWVLELLAYYMFYLISREYGENLELLAFQRKAEMDQEMYQTTKTIYEEMSAIRHEIKNHDTYMRALLEKKDYQKLGEFLIGSQTESREFYQYVNCGNVVVNTIVNYEASVAKAKGIGLKAAIVIPGTLPVRESELSSLLFNLLNNAIEACVLGSIADPVIQLTMNQKGDYLFIRVQNPVDESIPEAERLKLKSTKKNQKLHGYGTRVIGMLAERYHGQVKYSIRDGQFIADVMLEIPETGSGENSDSGSIR